MSSALCNRFRLLQPVVQVNCYSVQRLFSSRTDSHHRDRTSVFRRLLLAVGTGVIGYATYKEKLKFPEALGLPTVSAATSLKGRRDQFNFIADVVAVSSPAVVYIEIQDAHRVDLFTRKPIIISNGSGFIVQPDGLILTNAHVVVNKPHTIVKVKLQDGSSHTGFVEDVDMQSDLATLRIPVKNLPIMKLGSSASLRPGEWVVAMGSPLSLSNTVTAGVVSSTQRASEELGLHDKKMSYIQTDAPITFGNSGGPLVNLDGEAIGINSMKVTPGISFAIPIDYVKEFLAKGKGKSPPVARKYLGITMLSLNPNILAELRMRNPEMPGEIENGIIVWKVLIGSPAHTGGLQPGDIVTEINGKPVHTPNDIYSILQTAGRELTVAVLRGNKRLSIKITPEDAH